MNAPSKTRPTCRLCSSTRLELALPMSPTPIGDNYSAPGSKIEEAYFNLDVCLCMDCGQVQLREVVSPDLLYPEFPYVTSVSVGLSEHFVRFAETLIADFQLPANSFVVEIGSNEGPMLRAFKSRGCRVLGVEPARSIARAATESGVPTLAEYFTSTLADTLRSDHGSAQVIAANNVLANIDDIDDVFVGISKLLAPEGLLVMETSYWADVVERGLIDTIYHEHISYFSVAPLRRFFSKHGLHLIDATRNENKGGSIRLVVQRAGGPRKERASVSSFVERERNAGIHSLEASQRCRAHLDAITDSLHKELAVAKTSGRVLVGYGASVGTTTMIEEFKLGDEVRCLLDDNRRKFGKISPGRHIPCVEAASAPLGKNDDVIIFAWRYIDQIVARHPNLRADNRRLLFPLPHFSIS